MVELERERLHHHQQQRHFFHHCPQRWEQQQHQQQLHRRESLTSKHRAWKKYGYLERELAKSRVGEARSEGGGGVSVT